MMHKNRLKMLLVGSLFSVGVFADPVVMINGSSVQKLASKVARMRIFSDGNGKLSKSVSDVDGGILVVSNFTLCASCSKRDMR